MLAPLRGAARRAHGPLGRARSTIIIKRAALPFVCHSNASQQRLGSERGGPAGTGGEDWRAHSRSSRTGTRRGQLAGIAVVCPSVEPGPPAGRHIIKSARFIPAPTGRRRPSGGSWAPVYPGGQFAALRERSKARQGGRRTRQLQLPKVRLWPAATRPVHPDSGGVNEATAAPCTLQHSSTGLWRLLASAKRTSSVTGEGTRVVCATPSAAVQRSLVGLSSDLE